MTNNRTEELLTFAHLQMASEALLHVLGPEAGAAQKIQVLKLGNKHNSLFTNLLAQQFINQWSIVRHWPNSSTGFSATLFKSKKNEYTLSFRSTEYVDDANQDVMATGDLEIRRLGWAFGQISDMEDVYREVKGLIGADTKFNLTGYSLGAHLATAFNILRREESEMPGGPPSPVLHTYTFNGAGTGGLKPGVRLTDVLATFNEVRRNPNSDKWLQLPELLQKGIRDTAEQRVAALFDEQRRVNRLEGAFEDEQRRPPLSVQASVQYQIAALVAGLSTIASVEFPLFSGVNDVPLAIKHADNPFPNMTEVFGADRGRSETKVFGLENPSFAAFSGLHHGQKSLGIYVEEQPIYRGNFLTEGPKVQFRVVNNPGVNDFADSHSLVLLIDSLSLMSAFSALDPTLTQDQIERIFAASSYGRRNTAYGTQGSAEGDTLENALDALRRLIHTSNTAPTPSSLNGNTWHDVEKYREAFHVNISNLLKAPLFTASVGRARVEVREWDEVLAYARTPGEAGIPWRYALKELNAFAVTGNSAIYSQHNSAGELDIHNPVTQRSGLLTQAWLEDRALFLKWKNIRNREDVADTLLHAGVRQPQEYVDLGTGYSVTVTDLTGLTNGLIRVIFGSDASEAGARSIVGGQFADRLYGGGGYDQIIGDKGRDYLEGNGGQDVLEGGVDADVLVGGPDDDVLKGGKGLDTYIIGQDRDTIIDEDRRGVVMDASGNRVAGHFIKRGTDYVLADNPQITATMSSSLTITLTNGAQVVIQDFKQGEFGIHLIDAMFAAAPPKVANLTTVDDTQFVMSETPVFVRGQAGNDFIQTLTPARVVIEGGAGGDLVAGGDGADEIFGGLHSDGQAVVYGHPLSGTEREAAYGGGGDDEVVGGAGNDWLAGGPGSDLIYGGPGVDLIAGGGGMYTTSYWLMPQAPGARRPFVQDTLTFNFDAGGHITREQGAFFEADGRVIRGTVPALRMLDDRDGADRILAGSGSDEVWGGWDNDYIDGEADDDIIYGEEGDDTLFGGAGADAMHGDAEMATMSMAHQGEDYLDGEGNDDTLRGGGASDILFGGDGNDILYGDSASSAVALTDAADYLDGQGGNDLLFGAGGDDQIFGGDGLDMLSGAEGADYLDGGKAGDTLYGEAGADQLYGGADNDELAGGADGDYLAGGQGEDTLWGDGGADTLSGDEGHDQIFGGQSDDQLLGGAGNDTLRGEEGNDVLSGDGGVDLLIGGPGDDTYILSLGGGVATIIDTSGTNHVIFRDGITVDRLKIARNTYGANVTIEYAAGDTVTITDAVAGAIRDFQFADGTIVTAKQLFKPPPPPTVNGTGANDTITASAASFVNADAGNDTVTGSAGDDEILGGAGSDSISGREGNDVIEGGPGDDSLKGEGGSDTYRFNRGSGVDTIDEQPTFGEHNTVVMGADVLPGEVTVRMPAYGQLVLSLANGADRVVIQGWYGEGALGEPFERPVSATGIDEVRFASSVVWDQTSLLARANVVTAGNDLLFGMTRDDTFAGLEGDDRVFGNAGDDTLSGDAGSDQLSGGRGFDVLRGGAGPDYLDGGDDADVLDGGADDETLAGGSGDDVYVFGRNYGTDVVLESGFGLDTDTLAFASGVLPQDLIVSPTPFDQAHIEVRIAGTTDRLVLDFVNGTTPIERVTFTNGTSWTGAELVQRLVPTPGTEGDDRIEGTPGNDVIDGLGGYDSIYGGAGDDLIRPARGNAILDGGPGADVYELAPGFGYVSINDANRTFGDASLNIVRFAAGIEPADLVLARANDSNDSFAGLKASVGTDTLTIEGWFNQDDYRGTLKFVFASGESWDAAAIAGRVAPLPPTAQPLFLLGGPGKDSLTGVARSERLHGNAGDDRVDGGDGIDSVYGGSGNDVVLGGPGMDSLYGEQGRDRLNGGPGDDRLDGGPGDDTYVFGAGNGRDVVREERIPGAGLDFDTIEIEAGIAPAEVTLRSDAWNHELRLSSGDTITIPATEAFRVTFGDGTVWTPSPLRVLQGGPSNDRLSHSYGQAIAFGRGFGQDEVALSGSESVLKVNADVTPDKVVLSTVFSASREPSLKIGLTDGPDSLVLAGWFRYGEPGRRVSQFHFANGTVWDATQIDARIRRAATDGADYLYGTASNDTLSGGAGDDHLEGGSRDDVITGGAGNDVLGEGRGNDRYLFSNGFGEDTFGPSFHSTDQAGGYDTIEFDATVDWRNVVVSSDGSNLRIQIVNTSNAITLPGWMDAERPHQIAAVKFALGNVVWDAGVLAAKVTPVTNAPELIRGTAVADTYDALGGNDYVYGHAGNDTLSGAAGDDQLTGDAGDDVLSGGPGGDFLYGVSGNDRLNGDSDSDHLNGGYGADTLDGGTGADTMLGGPDNDTYIVDNADDVVSEKNGGGIDLVHASVSYALPANIDNLVLTGGLSTSGTGNTLSNRIVGNSGNNTLTGGAGNDTLDGDAGIDLMLGGVGNDTYYVDETFDRVDENANEGTDVVQSTATYVLSANIEELALTGTAAIDGTGNAAANILRGNSSANVLDGGGGADSMSGGAGDDTYVLDTAGDIVVENANQGTDTVLTPFTYRLGANFENLTLTGTAPANAIGNSADNVLIGNSAANGLSGGAGNDTYVIESAGDTVTEATNEGVDTIRSSIAYTLGDHIENLVLNGTGAIAGAGNALDNVIAGNAAKNTLSGAAGNDTLLGGAGADAMTGGPGNDDYEVDDPGDTVTENAAEGTDTVRSTITHALAANVEHLTLVGTAEVNGTGNALDNTLTGNAAKNALAGRAGNDTYVIDSTADLVVENAGEGTDLVRSTASYKLPENVEHLTLTGSAAIDATGNSLANTLRGNSAANVLDGSAGADDMAGGLGDDTYRIDHENDLVTEHANEGKDTVQSAIAYTLGLNIENLVLVGAATTARGNAANNYLTGNAGANTLTGLEGDDRLDGGVGADAMTGGLGNDIYYIDDPGDRVIEAANGGLDGVRSRITHTLEDNVESLRLAGTAAIDGIGNSLDNELSGNSARNRLSGRAGNDTYVIDDAADLVIENANEGIDTVQSAVTYVLPDHVEKLALTGSSAIDGTGNELDNELSGNAAANRLAGLAGNDIYVVDGSLDAIIENANEGRDEVRSSRSHALAANVENLTLTGTAAVDASGNDLSNVLKGNSAANVLSGGANADSMKGGAGDDIYYVDDAGDSVVENANEGVDEVRSSVDHVLAANVEKLTLTGSLAIDGTGNGLDNELRGNAAANMLSGRAGNDTYFIDDAADIVVENPAEGTDVVRSSVAYILTANVENLVLTGSSSIKGTGNPLDNVITSNAGTTTLVGLAGNDIYIVDATLDAVVEKAGDGNDEVRSSASYTLSENVEKLTLTGSSAIAGTGNTLDNVLSSNAANNTLTGGAGNDVIDGGAGTDVMAGGAGNDTYTLDSGADTVRENANEGIDTVKAAFSYRLGANVENLTLLGSAAVNGSGNELGNQIRGNAAGNILTGDAGNDHLDGGAGADTLTGGPGDDKYIVESAGDLVTEKVNEGADTVEASIPYILGANLENLTLTGTAEIDATGNGLVNAIKGNSAANVLDGGAGGDRLTGGAGDDTYWLDSIADTVIEIAGEGIDSVRTALTHELAENVENLTLTGNAAVNGIGNALDNVITGNSAANVLTGRSGHDTYHVTPGDVVLENLNEGTDTVISPLSYTLAANVENLRLANGLNDFDAKKAHYIALWGEAQWEAHAWTDVYGEWMRITPDEEWRLAFTDAIGNTLNNVLTGDVQDNWLEGGAGNDTLRGGARADLYIGGAGNDTYYVDDADYSLGGGSVTVWSNLFTRYFTRTLPAAEQTNGGTDTVVADMSYRLRPNFENLTLAGTAAIDGTGNDTANVIIGNAAANRIDGRGGADTMRGGAGNDTYIVDDTGDVVTENANHGTDTVESYITYRLGDTLEHLTLVGDAAVNSTGNALANTLTGNSAANVLDGGVGGDTMIGGYGDDTYVIDDAGDRVTENAAEGNDTIRTPFTTTLGENFENLTLTGTSAVNGTGNALDNVLTGNSAVNKLAGRAGNDIYVVDSASDVITEAAGEGTDTVKSSVTYTLGANVENLTLTGGAAATGTGNGLDNVLTSSSTAGHTLIGRAGNDTYVVDSAADIVTENANEGIDIVRSSAAAYTLSANVEHVVLIDAGLKAVGNVLANTLTGNELDNELDGSGGTDTMIGGLGSDTYVVDLLTDVIEEYAGEGSDTVRTGISYTLGTNLENLVLTGTVVLTGTGNALDNELTGNAAASTLVGRAGNDTYIVDSTTDTLAEVAGEGTDTVRTSVSYRLGSNLENLTLTGTAPVEGIGNSLANVLTGNSAVNRLAGLTGNDVYVVDDTMDEIVENPNEGTDEVRSSVTYTLDANVEVLTLTGTAAIDGTGNALANTLIGNVAVNRLAGRAGDDVYIVDDARDVIVENPNEGADEVRSSVHYMLGPNLEKLTLVIASWATGGLTGTGNDAPNTLVGTGRSDVLDGRGGADTMSGGLGDDVYYVDNAYDIVTDTGGRDAVNSAVAYELAADIENLTLTGSGAIDGTGNALSNRITGNAAANTLTGAAGNDSLDGAGGADRLIGGLGNDEYSIDSADDVVIEVAGEGTDTVVASLAAYTLGANVENARAGAWRNASITGNELANRLLGWQDDNVLDGGVGADYMEGGEGSDTYILDNPGDIVFEQNWVDSTVDTVKVPFSYTLDTTLENLTLTGSAAANGKGNERRNVLKGNTAANTLTGYEGDDLLDGGGGADRMLGGPGDDTYVIDDAGDVVTELADEGLADTVQSFLSHTLDENFENLTLLGTGTVDGAGNSGRNWIAGNSARNALTGGDGNDILDGGGGIDTFAGGAGDDLYRVDDSSEIITETTGVDTVESTATYYTLGANVENLQLAGTAAIAGAGNDLDNMLNGNTAANALRGGLGNDTLDGGGGVDSMAGGAGDDTYYVDNAADTIDEAAGEGSDIVYSTAAAYTLAANVESLTLAGTGAIDGAGNAFDNGLAGNDSNNALYGEAGRDWLSGKNGDDLLNGGTGNDTLFGDLGRDILQGMDGDESLVGGEGNDLLMGGAGADTLTAHAQYSPPGGETGVNDFLAGGAGNDHNRIGDGADIIAFNRGDGQDTVGSSTSINDTLTLGGGIGYADMSFTRSGNTLTINLGGAGDSVTFDSWYVWGTVHQSVLNMQVIAEAMADFDAASVDNLRNRKVATFDFRGLTNAFDNAGAPDNWRLTDALLTEHLRSTSDTVALGADLAYRYGRDGKLTGLGFDPVQGMLASGSFGVTAQALQSDAALMTGARRLA